MHTKKDLGHDSPTRAFIYLRVSSAGQVKTDYDKEGLSLPAQREECTRKARAIGATVVDEFVDPGVSGTSLNKRKSFQAMLKAIEARGDIDYVVIWSVSRWARDQEDHWVTRGLVKRAGARLVSVKEPIGGESASEITMEGVMAAVAAGRSIETSEDVKRGMKRKAKVGGTPGLAPLGYVNTSIIHDGHAVRDVIPDPGRAELLAQAFQLYATGKYSLEELCALLEARGLRTRPTARLAAKALTPNRLSKILRNPYYIGTVTLNDKPYPGRHEPLVPSELFQTVQEVLTSRRQNGARAWKHHHYLAGTLFCGNCGGRLLYSQNRGRGGNLYEYYFCIGKHHGSCDQPYHRLIDLERAVEAFYGRIHLGDEERLGLRDDLLAQLHQLSEASRRDSDATAVTATQIARQEKKLLEAFYADSISADLFHSEQARLRRERAATDRVLTTLSADLAGEEAAVSVAVDLMASPQEAYRRGTPRHKGLMNQGFFKALYVDDGEITNGDLQPVFDQLLMVVSERRSQAEEGAGDALRAAIRRAQKQIDPQAVSGLGGSKVERMVPPRRIELLLQA